jgi:ABC-type lipoprotein release transport system permease subunit
LSWYDKKLEKSANPNIDYNNSLVAFNMIITNLNTIEDYEKINKELRTINGVEDIGPYNHKKLSVIYNQYLTSIEHIVYKLSQMGYRYVNRF